MQILPAAIHLMSAPVRCPPTHKMQLRWQGRVSNKRMPGRSGRTNMDEYQSSKNNVHLMPKVCAARVDSSCCPARPACRLAAGNATADISGSDWSSACRQEHPTYGKGNRPWLHRKPVWPELPLKLRTSFSQPGCSLAWALRPFICDQR